MDETRAETMTTTHVTDMMRMAVRDWMTIEPTVVGSTSPFAKPGC